MKNIKWIVFAVLFSGVGILSAQQLTKAELIGTWKVAEVEEIGTDIPEEQKKYLAEMESALAASVLIFKADQAFVMEVALEELAANVRDTYWNLSDDGEIIYILESAASPNEDAYLRFEVEQKDGSYLLHIPGMPFILKIKKSTS